MTTTYVKDISNEDCTCIGPHKQIATHPGVMWNLSLVNDPTEPTDNVQEDN